MDVLRELSLPRELEALKRKIRVLMSEYREWEWERENGIGEHPQLLRAMARVRESLRASVRELLALKAEARQIRPRTPRWWRLAER